jgi:diguanylate cyclase (GGDEF)-like protein
MAHAQALRSVAGAPTRPLVIGLQALGLAVAFYLLGSQLTSLTHRMRLFDGMIFGGSALTLWLLRPLIRFWGARLIAAMMGLAIVFQSLRFGALLVGIDVELPPEAALDLRGSIGIGALVIDLVIALFITSAFVLLQQERLRERIERLVVTDPLTGALNRRGMMPLLDGAWAQAQRHGRPMSVVLLDLDHFKRVNDQHGHATGDEVLAGFADRVGAQLRKSDALGRWGGEEFLVLLTDTDLAGAHGVAERLRQAVAARPMASRGLRITVSAGVSCLDADACRSGADTLAGLLKLLDDADRRLYLAKQQRNCVVSTEAGAKRSDTASAIPEDPPAGQAVSGLGHRPVQQPGGVVFGA